MKLRPLLAGAAISAALLFAFWELAEEFAGTSEVVGFDSKVTALVQGWRAPWLTAAMTGITAAGSTPAVLLAAFILLVSLMTASRAADAVFAAAVVSLGGALSWLAKGSFARARPPVENALIPLPLSFSFPSGHTMGSFCLAYVAVYLTLRARWSGSAKAFAISVAVAYAVLVGVSRVYLGVHWPSDVVAGWLLGGAIAAAAAGARAASRGMRPRPSSYA